MSAICPNRAVDEDVNGDREMWPVKAHSQARRAVGRSRRSESGRLQMSTIEIHEPEVKEVKPAGRPIAASPRTEIVWGPPVPPKPMFSDSMLEFGVQRKRRFFATSTSFALNCFAIG